jgi:prophage regulatory protein
VESAGSEHQKVERVVRFPEVKRTTGLSAATIYRKIAANEFPRPIPLGVGARGWLLSEIQNWIADRVAARAKHEDC